MGSYYDAPYIMLLSFFLYCYGAHLDLHSSLHDALPISTASSYGVTVCPHWFHDLHAQLVAATPNARYVEFFPDDQVLNFRRLIDAQLAVKDGMLILPKTPGLGFGFDEGAVARHALDRKSVV